MNKAVRYRHNVTSLNMFNPGHTADAEKLMMTYNLSGARAAVPSFAKGSTDKKSALATDATSQISIVYLHPLWTRLAANAGFERLLLWLKLPDNQEHARHNLICITHFLLLNGELFPLSYAVKRSFSIL